MTFAASSARISSAGRPRRLAKTSSLSSPSIGPGAGGTPGRAAPRCLGRAHHLVVAPRRGPRGEDRIDRLAVLPALRRAREARVLGEAGRADRGAEPPPLVVAGDGDRHPGVVAGGAVDGG